MTMDITDTDEVLRVEVRPRIKGAISGLRDAGTCAPQYSAKRHLDALDAAIKLLTTARSWLLVSTEMAKQVK